MSGHVYVSGETKLGTTSVVIAFIKFSRHSLLWGVLLEINFYIFCLYTFCLLMIKIMEMFKYSIGFVSVVLFDTIIVTLT